MTREGGEKGEEGSKETALNYRMHFKTIHALMLQNEHDLSEITWTFNVQSWRQSWRQSCLVSCWPNFTVELSRWWKWFSRFFNVYHLGYSVRGNRNEWYKDKDDIINENLHLLMIFERIDLRVEYEDLSTIDTDHVIFRRSERWRKWLWTWVRRIVSLSRRKYRWRSARV